MIVLLGLAIVVLSLGGIAFTVPVSAPRPSPLVQEIVAAGTSMGGSAPWNAQIGSSISASMLLFGLAAVSGAGVAQSRRRSVSACEAVGLLYATQTGNTETVAGYIAEVAGVEAADVGDYSAEDLTQFDGLIVGCPTWATGADEYRSGTAWDELIDEIKGLDLAGKPVAVFGCGDSEGYGDNFCDGIEELHSVFQSAGAKLIGYVDSSDYNHEESKSDIDGKFVGCPFDEDNESDKSEDRAKAWVDQLKSEGMPL